jgi:hypothetical protein
VWKIIREILGLIWKLLRALLKNRLRAILKKLAIATVFIAGFVALIVFVLTRVLP